MIDVNDIRKEIAVKRNVLLDKDDPALVIVALFEALQSQYVNDLNAQQEANVKALTNAIQKGLVESKAIAGRVITEGAGYASDQVHAAVSSAMDEGREEIRKDLRLAWGRIEASRKAAVTWAAVSSVCAGISIAALLAILF